MNYIITGSTGHISNIIIKNLVKAGHSVTVVTTKESKKKDIEEMNAKAAIGSVQDKNFIKSTFSGADAVYLMVPPNFAATDLFAYQKEVADNYVEAIKAANIQNVVLLSSIGAHLGKGAGPIDGLAYLEEQLEQLKAVNTIALRPSYFFYNLFQVAPMLKNAGITGASYGSDTEKVALTHTDDIAEIASKHLLNLDFKGFGIQYIASDEQFTSDVAKTLGDAVGKANTPWIVFSDEQAKEAMQNAGLNSTHTAAFVQMNKSLREGILQSDYWKNRPVLGKVKLGDFAKEFAGTYAALF